MKDSNGDTMHIFSTVKIGACGDDAWRVMSGQDEMGDIALKNVVTGLHLHRHPSNVTLIDGDELIEITREALSDFIIKAG